MDEHLVASDSLTPVMGLTDSDYSSQDSGDDTCISQTKLQFRSLVLKACWKDDIGMSEIVKHKGNLLKSMGIIRSGKIYLNFEETLFLVQIGALLLVDDQNTTIPLSEIYSKAEQEKTGCSWVGFKVYQHLKALGYIVGRFGIPWSLKSTRPIENNYEKDDQSHLSIPITSVVESLNGLELNKVNPLPQNLAQSFQKLWPEKSRFVVHLPVYEVYLPNSQFKKTCPGDPNFVVYTASGHPPSLSDIEELERQSNDLPLKVGHVEDGRVSLFSFDKVELPVLP